MPLPVRLTRETVERTGIATHILAFEGDSKVVWCEGNFRTYEEQKRARLGEAADQPTRIKYRKLRS